MEEKTSNTNEESKNNSLEQATAQVKKPARVRNKKPVNVIDAVAEEIDKEVKKPVRTLIIGTVDDEDSSLLSQVMKFNQAPESPFNVDIITMEEDEITRFVARRASLASEKSVEEYIAHEPNKKAAKELAFSIERNMNSKGKFFELKKLYKNMRVSKGQVDETIATLELFKLAEVSDKPNGKRYVKIILTDEDIADNRLFLLSKQVQTASELIKELVEITLKETSSSALQLEVSEEMQRILKPLNYVEGATTNTKA